MGHKKKQHPIRAAAERAGLGIDEFRKKAGIPNTSFYMLLHGWLPATVAKREEYGAALRRAGVRGMRGLVKP